MTAPPINAKTFPYRRKWTKEQIDEIVDRKDRLTEAMTDAVGPVGQVIYIDASVVHIMALHLALAGAEVHDDLAYITPVIINEPGAPADFHNWVLKSEYKPAPVDPEDVKHKAEVAADQIRRQLSPEVRAEVVAMMLEEHHRIQNAERDDRMVDHDGDS